MKKALAVFVFAGLAIPLLVALPEEKHTISGKVLDDSDQAIAAVQVQVYRGSRTVGKPDPAVSGKDGTYSVEFMEGDPIDSVRYDHSDWYPAIVEDISGRYDHSLYKTLHKRGQSLTYFQGQKVLSAFERIYEIDRSLFHPLISQGVAAWNGEFRSVVAVQVQPGKGKEWYQLWQKYNKPILDQLQMTGTISRYEVNAEEVHTEEKPSWRYVVYHISGKDDLETVRAAFHTLEQERTPEEQLAISKAYADVTVVGTQWDIIARAPRTQN